MCRNHYEAKKRAASAKPRACVICAGVISGTSYKYCGDSCSRLGEAYKRRARQKRPDVAAARAAAKRRARKRQGPEHREKRRQYERTYRQRPHVRAKRRAESRVRRQWRRAIVRGATAEKFDPLTVFERDGWKCGICREQTLKAKRGTTHPRAPELDHIIPLAAGGAHTMANTQCSCRACNLRKGATVLGQMRMFG